MQPELKEIFKKINFKNRYKEIYQKRKDSVQFESYDQNKVKTIIEKFGYNCTFNKSESFFSVREKKKNKFDTSLNISLKYGVIEFILNFDFDGKGFGKPFGYICQLLDDSEIIKKPGFANYDELEDSFKDAFAIYEDVKKELLSL